MDKKIDFEVIASRLPSQSSLYSEKVLKIDGGYLVVPAIGAYIIDVLKCDDGSYTIVTPEETLHGESHVDSLEEAIAYLNE